MPLTYEPVAIPVTKGVDVTTRARLVDPSALLEAENARFTALGSEKRRGHVGRIVMNAKPLGGSPPNYQSPARDNIPEEWLWGWGHIVETIRADSDELLATSPHPYAGILFGAATRDQESLFWDGFRMFSRTPEQIPGTPMTDINAVMPHLHSAPTSKAPHAQHQPDAADNGRIRVVAWLNPDDSDIWYTVQDSETLAYIVPPTALGFVDPAQVRVINVDRWVHIMVAEDDLDTLYRNSIFEETPREISRVSLGPCDQFFDTVRVSELTWAVLINRGDRTVRVTQMHPDGSSNGTSFDYDYSATATGSMLAVALGISVTDGTFAIVIRHTDGIGPAINVHAFYYSSTGVELSNSSPDTVSEPSMRVAITPRYLNDINNDTLWDIFWDDIVDDIPQVRMQRTTWQNTYLDQTRHWLYLASSAFRVGDRSFIWAANTSPLQSTWILIDEALLPVGHMNFITADTPGPDTFPRLASVNWNEDQDKKDVFEFSMALGYRVRVPVITPETGANEARIFTEPSVQFVHLDFLPPLYSAQAGRCTYFPGSQLWAYDGVELVESGFHLAPEFTAEEVIA